MYILLLVTDNNPFHFLNLNTDLIVSKTKVKNSQNPIALVQDYFKIGILEM